MASSPLYTKEALMEEKSALADPKVRLIGGLLKTIRPFYTLYLISYSPGNDL